MSGAIPRLQGETFAAFAARQKLCQDQERELNWKPKRTRKHLKNRALQPGIYDDADGNEREMF